MLRTHQSRRTWARLLLGAPPSRVHVEAARITFLENMRDTDQANGEELTRVLGPVDATCVVVGAIIGVGIFFTPSRIAQLAGSGNLALLAWTIGGAIALLGALTFAELGGRYPRTGAQYDILRDAYGPFPAFLFVFCNATAVQAAAIAIIAVVCTQHLCVAFGSSDPGDFVLASGALILIIGLAVANCLGTKWGSRIQNATVFVKIGTLLLVTLLAATADSPETAEGASTFTETGPPRFSFVGGLFAALVPALFAYGGWQHALWIAGEVRQPGRNVPLAIIGGVILVVLAYLLVNWAYLRLLGHSGVASSEALAADAVDVLWKERGRRAIAGAVAISAFGVLNAQFLSGPRLIYEMARDGRFFKPFAGTSSRFGTPLPAILLLGGISIVLLLAAGRDGVDKLLTGAVLIDGVFFALTGAALLVLRKRRPDTIPSVRVPLYPVVPLLFVFGEAAVVIGAYCDEAVRGAAYLAAVWIVGAAVCYFVFFRTRGVHSDSR
jgi:APA family basic amino acid/polyamine antiporter